MAGCGLGERAIHDSGRGPQVLASTLNQLSSQIYAITTGTSGCDAEAGFEARLERTRFVAANYRSLSRDLAAGQGEYAKSLAALLGCRPEAQSAFLSFAKDKHAVLFPAAGSSPEWTVERLEAEIARDPVLRQGCTL